MRNHMHINNYNLCKDGCYLGDPLEHQINDYNASSDFGRYRFVKVDDIVVPVRNTKAYRTSRILLLTFRSLMSTIVDVPHR